LQNPSQINGDNVQNLRRETSREFGKKEIGYLKEKLMSLKLITIQNISETCTEAEMNLRKGTNLELML
jgi:hypothetical protein